MRVVLYVIILSLLFLAPLHRLDVAQLEPVQTLAVQVSNGIVMLETDTGQKGQGSTVQLAIADLEANTPGVIYLDTAQYLLIADTAFQRVQDLQQHLRSGVRVCIWDGEGSVSGAAKYLQKRTDLPHFSDWISKNEKSQK